MNKHIIPILIVLLLLSSGFVGVCSIPSTLQNAVEKKPTVSFGGNILYVGGSGPNNYTTIQEAINDAKNGDTVFVYDDSSPYHEQIVVNKRIEIIGENRETTVIDAQEKGTVVYIRARGVMVRGFTISGSKQEPLEHYAGIKICSNNNKITDNNIVENKDVGIYLKICSRNNIISENNISNNSIGGICLSHFSNNNIISKNIIANNKDFYCVAGIFGGYFINNNVIESNYIVNNNCGVSLLGFRNTIIGNMILANSYDGGILIGGICQLVENNIITNNKGAGINLRYIRYSKIYSNEISGSNFGVILLEADRNRIIENNITENSDGIRVYSNCDRNIIEKNYIGSNSHDGIYLQYSGILNSISNNDICFNLRDGIHSWISGGNIYRYNNISSNHRNGICHLNNSDNNVVMGNIIANNYEYGILFANSSLFNSIYYNNFIDNSVQAFDEDNNHSNSWYRVMLMTGNYWSDYTGEDNEWPFGIGDIPYVIPENNKDNYPLMEPLDIDIYNFKEIENSINPFTNKNNNGVLYQQSQNRWFLQFSQNHPRMFPILRQLLGFN